MELTIDCYLLSREIPTQKSYLEQPFKGQFYYGDDCKGLLIPEAIGTFWVCLVAGGGISRVRVVFEAVLPK